MATLTLTVAASTDDAVYDSGTGYLDSPETMTWGAVGDSPNGSNHGQGVRFTNVTLTSADTVTSVYLDLMKAGDGWSNVDWRLVFTAEDNAPTFSSGNPPGARAITSNIAAETLNVNHLDGVRYQFPSSAPLRATLAASLNAVLARGGWASGNAIVLVNNSDQDASAVAGYSREDYHAYDSATASSEPQLVIEYTPAPSGAPYTLTAAGGTFTHTGTAVNFRRVLTLQPDSAASKDTMINSGAATFNYGMISSFALTTTIKALLGFDLSGIPSAATCDSATLTVYQAGTGSNSAFTLTARQIASGNSAWIEGTRNAVQALAGEPCWNARVANGSGGVTNAWAGSAGLATSGTDFETTALGTASGNRSNANGTAYAITLSAARVQGWFGVSNTNYGILLTTSAITGAVASSDHATPAWRPKLVVTYSFVGAVSGSPYSMPADSGTFTLTGIAANPEYGRRFSSEAATYALAGTAASLERGYKLQAATNAFTLTGTASSLEYGRRFSAASASFTLQGQDATLTYGTLTHVSLSVDAAAFTLTGIAATFKVAVRLTLGSAAYTVTGVDAALSYAGLTHYSLTAVSGAFALTGIATNLALGRTLQAATSIYTLTGMDIAIALTRALLAASGDYALTGIAAELTWSAYVVPPTPAERTYTVAYEDRTFVVDGEDRTYTVPSEARILELA